MEIDQKSNEEGRSSTTSSGASSETENGFNGRQQVDAAKKLVLTNKDTIPEAIGSVVQIITEDKNGLDVQLMDDCLGFFIKVFEDEEIDKNIKKISSASLPKALLSIIQKDHCLNSPRLFQKSLQVSSLIFNHIFLYVMEKKEGYQEIWDEVQQLKTVILSNLTTNFPIEDSIADQSSILLISVKLMIIKFIGIVILAQLPTPPKDPRKRDRKPAGADGEVSISMAKNHPLINENLKAEAMGLLDLLLNTITDGEFVIPQIDSAIFQVLISFIKKRPSAINRILSQVVMFDTSTKLTAGWQFRPKDKKFNKIKSKLIRRCSDRSFKIFLNFLFKNNILNNKSSASDHDSMSAKYYSKRSHILLYQDKQRKEKNLNIDLPEDIAYYKFIDRKKDEEKHKEKINLILSNSDLTKQDINDIRRFYPKVSLDELYSSDSSTNKTSYSSLFSLIDDSNKLREFDVSLLNNAILTQLITLAINKTPRDKLSTALNIISERYKTVQNNHDDSMGPNKRIKLDTDFVSNNVENLKDLDYFLPPPKPMNNTQRKQHIKYIISNYLKLANSKELQSLIENQEDTHIESNINAGIIKMSKVAISKWEKNSWAILLVRLATRGLYNGEDEQENQELSDLIRNALFTYFLESIHSRMDIVIEWLNEEWYAEYVQSESKILEDHNYDIDEDLLALKIQTPTYIHWTIKILDSIIPFLEAKDRKIFIRLLSDLPYLNKEIILKLRSLCVDRINFNLGLQTLQYLIMVRPPVKVVCIDLLVDVYKSEKDNEELVRVAEKLLKKYKPEIIETKTDSTEKMDTS